MQLYTKMFTLGPSLDDRLAIFEWGEGVRRELRNTFGVIFLCLGITFLVWGVWTPGYIWDVFGTVLKNLSMGGLGIFLSLIFFCDRMEW